ncbi:transcriptional regulator, winged helix family [Fimbriimonas ginsengisoli Gsoil 348]|uniref:Transcriptional regulator, winged helix family n=1 Tax=Fimbriimonas ginsengisoli Gsoil 348 TaxID=661478 RepID=A0A068NYC5_FIMGI|nr:transcriptional regulator, winged helix family [Fimbriimonas ginsengisoli Gsoil 348]
MRLFGSPEVLLNGKPMRRLRSRKGISLLAHLALKSPAEVSRDWLCEALWPDSPPEQGRLSLRQSLVDLRKALADQAERIESPSGRSLRFCSDDTYVDVKRFEELIASGEPGPSELNELEAIYRGPLIADWFEPSLLNERDAFQAAYVKYLSRYAKRSLEAADYETAIRCLRDASAAAPLQESLHRKLMTALADSGNVSEAVQVFIRAKANLRERLGLEPDPQTVALYQALLQSMPPSPAVTVRTERQDRIPRPLTPLVGREEEVTQILNLLAERPLVTITGPGGVGKSRTSAEVARLAAESSAFPDGVQVVSLEDVVNPDLVADHLVRNLGVADKNMPSASLALRRHLGNKRALLVLDNCEHVLASANKIVEGLLRDCHGLKILAASREPLSLNGEQVFPISPLRFSGDGAPIQEIRTSPATDLFFQRARLVQPGLRSDDENVRWAAKICRALDGIPLAIELAAARLNILPIAEVSQRMENRLSLLQSSERSRHPRHKTMEAAIDASYQLLNEEEKQAFRQLSVFEGGFTLESAGAVLEGKDPLAVVSRLIDTSLVYVQEDHFSPVRYSMYSTLREFGLGRLTESGELESTRRRHADEMIRLTTEMRDRLVTAEQEHAVERLRSERGNWSSALKHCPDNDRFVRLVHLLVRFWLYTASLREAKRWLDATFLRSEGADAKLMAWIYSHACAIANARDESREGIELAKEAIRRAKELGERDVLTAALGNIGMAYRAVGDYESAYRALAESIEQCDGTEPPIIVARAYANLGRTATDAGRYDAAEEHFRRSFSMCPAADSPRDYLFALQGYAWAKIVRGSPEAAKPLLAEALHRLRGLDDAYLLSWVFISLGSICTVERRYPDAAICKQIVRQLEASLGFEVSYNAEERLLAEAELIATELGPAKLAQIAEQTKAWSTDVAIDYGLRACSLSSG